MNYTIYTLRIFFDGDTYAQQAQQILDTVTTNLELDPTQLVPWYPVSSSPSIDLNGNRISRDCIFIISPKSSIQRIVDALQEEYSKRDLNVRVFFPFHNKDYIDAYTTIRDAYKAIIKYETKMISRSVEWLEKHMARFME